jgi:type I restriction enzyme R subunit
LEQSRVKGASGKRILTDLVSLVASPCTRTTNWCPSLSESTQTSRRGSRSKKSTGKKFTDEQRRWFEMIRDHIAANLSIEPGDFEYAPFAQEGGLGKGSQMFEGNLDTMLDELTVALVA